MSQWQNYGFPDLAGVSFQTALRGLTCALMERLQAVGAHISAGDNILNFYEDKKLYCYPIFRIVTDIDNLFYRLDCYVLPDGSVFSLKNAADYLQEELIDMDQLCDTEWGYPYSALKYEWCMQRYRFINLAWKTAPSMQYVNAVYEKHSGSGKTYSEAADKFEREEYNTVSSNTFEMSQITERGKDSWTVTRCLRIPDRVKYLLSAPGLLCLEITPRMTRRNCDGVNIPENALVFSHKQDDSFRQWQADDFGCGLTFNTPQIFFSQHIPETTAPGEEVELTGLYKHLSSLGKAASFPVPQSGYDYSMIARGFSAELSCFCDFRNYFDFYDPPGIRKAGFV